MRVGVAGGWCLLFALVGGMRMAGAQGAALPNAPGAAGVSSSDGTQISAKEYAEAQRISDLPRIHSRPYDQPSSTDLVLNFVNDSFGVPGQARTLLRAGYSQLRGRPSGWGTDAAGFGQRLGSAEAVAGINGGVRLGMEFALHEDLRYIPCHGCSAKHKIENALLAEITARHGEDGHRSFSLTPTVADFSGPIIAHTFWYPNDTSRGPLAGVVSARTVFVVRIGGHLFREFIFERLHRDVKELQ